MAIKQSLYFLFQQGWYITTAMLTMSGFIILFLFIPVSSTGQAGRSHSIIYFT